MIPPTRSKVSEYATASLKPLQRAAFVLRVKRILGSSKAPAQGGPGGANKDQDARKALAPIRDMAERTGTAVIAVRHLNKSVGLKAIQRGGGNMALIGVARAAVLSFVGGFA